MRRATGAIFFIATVVFGGAALAQTPAKQLFGSVATPVAAAPEVIGGYTKGCLAGATQIAATGPGWQAMRLSRNRRYAHPALAAFIETLSAKAQAIGWPGLLIGDLAQPIGGPMVSGHRSHQTGIDGDIWLTPSPDRELSPGEREKRSAPSYVARDRKTLTEAWTPRHHAVLRAAAEDAAVARIFVNAAIKQRLCEDAKAAGEDTLWLRKIRPWWGHNAHFHVRLNCPAGSPTCVAQDPPPDGDGCDQIGWWFSDEALNPKPKKADKKAKPRPQLTLKDMPPACATLLDAAKK